MSSSFVITAWKRLVKVIINGNRLKAEAWTQARGSKRISISDCELPIQENFEIRINVY